MRMQERSPGRTKRGQPQSGRTLKVDRDGGFVAVDGLKVTAVPAGAERRPPEAKIVPEIWTLDLQNLRAEVCEQHGAVGAGENAAEIEHSDTGQRAASHHGRPSPGKV